MNVTMMLESCWWRQDPRGGIWFPQGTLSIARRSVEDGRLLQTISLSALGLGTVKLLRRPTIFSQQIAAMPAAALQELALSPHDSASHSVPIDSEESSTRRSMGSGNASSVPPTWSVTDAPTSMVGIKSTQLNSTQLNSTQVSRVASIAMVGAFVQASPAASSRSRGGSWSGACTLAALDLVTSALLWRLDAHGCPDSQVALAGSALVFSRRPEDGGGIVAIGKASA